MFELETTASLSISEWERRQKKGIIALFYHFFDTSDRILILTSPVTFWHIQFDKFRRFDSNLSHSQLRDVGRKTGVYKVVKQYVDWKPRDVKGA